MGFQPSTVSQVYLDQVKGRKFHDQTADPHHSSSLFRLLDVVVQYGCVEFGPLPSQKVFKNIVLPGIILLMEEILLYNPVNIYGYLPYQLVSRISEPSTVAPAPSNGWCSNPKALPLHCTPCHKFGTPWRVQVYANALEVQPPFFICWFMNHHFFIVSKGLSSSKRNHHFF